jgi:CO/xanthine dehydrogenase FAD-binding subunit
LITGRIDYYKPTTMYEALELFESKKNKQPIYYSGGTEIITLSRLNLVRTGAIIDIKSIPECDIFEIQDDFLITGAAIPLTEVEEKNLFPLLSSASSEIADRTARNKITIGGNICGRIYYREAILPFLLADSLMIIASPNGLKSVSIHSVFNQSLQLQEGELLVQILTETRYLHLPFICIKRRQQWETGYPLVTVACLKKGDELRFAFSGVCPFPFRTQEIETELNNRGLPYSTRVKHALEKFPSPILNDVEGSKEYRLFVLKNILNDILVTMEGE